MSRRSLVAACLSLALAAGCASGTLTPRPTALPTRADPADAAQRGLALVLSELDHDLTQARSFLVFIAGAPQVRGGSADACTTYVASLARTSPQYTHISAITQQGIMYCDSGGRTRPFNVADRLYFHRVTSTHDFVVGEYLIGGATLGPSLALAYPVEDEAKTRRGAVIAPLSLSWLAQRIAEIEIPVTGEIVILDTYGNLILRDPDAGDWYGRNISESQLGKAMLGQLHGAGELAGADGQTRRYAYGTAQGSHNQLIAAVGIPR